MNNWIRLGIAILLAPHRIASAADLSPPIRFTELMYNPAGGDAYEFLEIQNTSDAAVDLSGDRLSGVEYTFPANSTIPAGRVWVLSSDIDPPAFATRYPGVQVAGTFHGHLSKHGERIALEDPTGHTLAAVTYHNSGFWPNLAEGSGSSLEINDPRGDPNDPSNWHSGRINGTPGVVPPFQLAAGVQINEVMASSQSSANFNGTAGADWIELFNNGQSAANLGGWSLTDEPSAQRKFVFPAAVQVAPQGYLVVWFDSNNAFGGIHTGFPLTAGVRGVGLFDPSTNRVDLVTFGSLVPGYSLARAGQGWTLGAPTPGASNVAAPLANPSSLVINEWYAASSPGEADWLELYNRNTSQPAALTGLFLSTPEHGFFQIKSPAFAAPGGFVRLQADEQGGAGHVDFKLPSSGGAIALFAAGGSTFDAVPYGPQSEGISQGRQPDGSQNFAFFLAGLPPSGGGTAPSPDMAHQSRSLLDLHAARPGSSGVPLRWQGVFGRSYTILQRPALNGPWIKLADIPAPSVNQQLEFQAPVSRTEHQRFFRLATPRLADPSEPVVLSVFPADNAAGVPVSSSVVITFREPMDAGSVTNGFRLTDDLGRTVSGRFQFRDSFTKVSFIPDVNLAHATRYTAFLADQLKNQPGSQLASSQRWGFQTSVAPDLVEDRSVYAADLSVSDVEEVRISLLPRPGGYTLADVNTDTDPFDNFEPHVDAIFREGLFGQGLTQPNGAIEQRGQTVRLAIQKSYRIILSKKSPAWNGRRTINLNKHPYDLTRVRNRLAFDLFKTIPHMVSMRTRFAHVLIDNVDYGFFTEIEEPNSDFFNAHGLDPDGELYKANFFEFYRYPETLRLRSDPNYNALAFNRIIEPKTNHDHQKLLAMLDDLNNPDIPINRIVDKYFNRQNYLAWLASNILANNADTSSRNFFLYSPAGLSAWYFIPWDYDDAWDFYNQPSQKNLDFLSRWRQGIANWWGVVLHRRFLQDPSNVADLSAKVSDLAANYFTTARATQLLNSYHDTVKKFLQNPPDLENLPVVDTDNPMAEFDGEFARLADLGARNFTNFVNTLDRPMPVFLGDPELVDANLLFAWDPSYDFKQHPLTYDFQISKTPAFDRFSIVTSQLGLSGTSLQIPNSLPDGQYFWRVIIRDATNPTQNWQVAFDNYTDDATGKIYHGIKKFVVR